MEDNKKWITIYTDEYDVIVARKFNSREDLLKFVSTDPRPDYHLIVHGVEFVTKNSTTLLEV